jgi:hypothetical protein
MDTTTQGDATTLPKENNFLNNIQSELLKQSSIVSSQGNEIDKRIQSAMGGVKSSAEMSNQAIESAYTREKAFAEMNASNDIQTHLEGRSGFATQMVAFRSLVETTDKNLKDLAMRKEELILQNNSAAASKVAELEMKALEFRQEASKQLYSNIFNMGELNLRSQQEERLQKEQKQKSTETIGKLLSENPQAGILTTDTLEQAYAKIGVKPNSPDMLYKKAQIDNIYNEIKNRNINAGKSSTVAGTEAERTANILSQYASKFAPNHVMSDGTPTIDENGFATPKAWKAAINETKVSRKDFITQFGYLLYADKKGVSKSYGLTPQELKLIGE